MGREEAVLLGMGRSFHHWGAREQFLWGWGGRSTTGERGSSSYGDGEVVPPLGSEGAVLMGMGRSFHHWGAREQFYMEDGERGSSSYGDGEVVPPLGSEGAVLLGMGRSLLGSEGAVLLGMGRSFHHWGAREQFFWGWGGRSTTGERGSSSSGDGEVVPPLGSEGAVLLGMGRSFHHWGAREQFFWGSYGDGEIVPPLGSEGAVLLGMGRSFHHWGAREQFFWGWGDRSTTGERGWRSSAVGTSERQLHGWQDGRGGLWQQSGVVQPVCRPE